MEDTRGRLLSVALALFADRGYNAVGVQDVCDAAAVTKPTLYYRFGSKRGLLEAIAEERYAPFSAAVRARARYSGDVASSLTGISAAFLESARADRDFARLRLSLAFSPPASEEHAVFRPRTEELYAAVTALFEAASADHGNMRGRAAYYAASFIGTADAYVGLLLADSLDPDTETVRRIVHYFMHGIFS
ncbi:MAG: hypothetical protein A2Z99_16120 [Treponema sp. GWB1_62_6]|nr:MAG: hypothetical protein A2Y36_11965 [Treponema sp. GWA1_62_8]OHE64127.1 MAG: hypothetical protein A2Z99_16120 [Treponema sp. GWB1_62_6]OHE65220.1 MAG: hypothetical protein A2001_03605 [Treponema sp. GWC1_61_84]OHE75841.1 MAG: hypothetical protein A2413_11485 [Treponema sp. RIFOXYC1_FULL_61_9]HCM26429.1 TetR/AcrR family transcriptional regulator [Treponema sp.]